MFERPKSGERAILVHLTFPHVSESSDAKEFTELAMAAGAEPVAKIFGRRSAPDPKFFIGKGKLEEVKCALATFDAALIIFNHELSPAQERNVERETRCRVLSRTGLILDIFAQRARTFEGKLQVELAQLNHMSTRLVRGWTHLERQKGGIGLRGPGETQLETDRRLLRRRVEFIKQRLDKVKVSREQSRRARTRQAIPTISLVGYTNAGKSTLFNALTGAHVLVANQLFATLDPTLRAIELPEVGRVILADTVGFVSRLPHGLVDAFRATLEEVSQSALLIHVVDAHDDTRDEHIHQVNLVLSEIGADDLQQIVVMNKSDLDAPLLQCEAEDLSNLINQKSHKIAISALTGQGLEQLLLAIQKALSQETVVGWIQVAPNEGKIRALFYQNHAVVEELPQKEGGFNIKIKVSGVKWRQMCRVFTELSSKLQNIP